MIEVFAKLKKSFTSKKEKEYKLLNFKTLKNITLNRKKIGKKS
jgi:hypothetical protein